jgi:hypothetical protein
MSFPECCVPECILANGHEGPHFIPFATPDERKRSIIEGNYSYKKAHEIISTAADLVGGNRQATHGDKVQTHQNIADLWSAYLGVKINPLQVALMMVLLKVARTKAGSLNLDDFVDAAGYAGVAAEIAQLESIWKETA